MSLISIYYKVFSLLIISLLLYNTISEIYVEIRDKTYFKQKFSITKNCSLLYYTHLNDLFIFEYTLISLFFDVIYAFKYLFNQPFLFFFSCLNYYILYNLFKNIPIIFCFLFIMFIMFNLFIIFIRIIFKINYTISLNLDYLLKYGWGFFSSIWAITSLPYIWSLIFIYSIIKLKNKLNIKDFNYVIYNYIIGKPFWFIKLLILTNYRILGFITTCQWHEKYLLYWPKIFIYKTVNIFIDITYDHIWKIHTIFMDCKIIISNGCIRVNPNWEKELLKIAMSEIAYKTPDTFCVVNVGNQRHQAKCIYDKDGYISHYAIQTSKNLKIYNNSVAILTNAEIPQYNVYSTLDNSCVLGHGFLRKNYFNNKFYDFNSFFGSIIKEKMSYNFLTNKVKLRQYPNKISVIETFETPKSYKHIYSNVYTEHLLTNDQIDISKFLYENSDKDIYHLAKSYNSCDFEFLCEIISKSHKNTILYD